MLSGELVKEAGKGQGMEVNKVVDSIESILSMISQKALESK